METGIPSQVLKVIQRHPARAAQRLPTTRVPVSNCSLWMSPLSRVFITKDPKRIPPKAEKSTKVRMAFLMG